MLSRRTYLRLLMASFALAWVLLAISPNDRGAWMMENLPLILCVAALAATYRTLPLSRASYTLIMLFLLLHAIGAHYTYTLVPWGDWLRAVGIDLDTAHMGRNHFDRFVHFLYGLLLAYPIREILLRVAAPRGFWGYFFPVAITLSTSAVYELAEWAVAITFGGDLGIAYIGTQGDVWDTQKDMALAGLGALIAMGIAGALNYALERDFAREWNESLKVKIPTPLGEDELWRLWRRWRDRNKPVAPPPEKPAAGPSK